jgi:hypothetical protein
VNQSCQPPTSDLDRLRAEFPGWTFGSSWTVVGTGPDRRRLWASRGAVYLSAWTVADLRGQVSTYTFPENGGS